jgi:dihydrofolate reductase
MVSIIVAHSRNRVIGRDGGMPWHLPGDLRRFREITTGGVVVMGRRTFESLPAAYRPLPNRRNLVLSRDYNYPADGAEVLPSLRSALAACGQDCFVIGGGVTYSQALPHVQRIYATQVDTTLEGDTFFPQLAPDEWGCLEQSPTMVENGHSFSFAVYERERI